MYMVVFVTLMVAIIGAYAQIYTKQAANAFAQQKGVVNALVAWHASAMGIAQSYLKQSTFSTPCSLTKVIGGGHGITSGWCSGNLSINSAYVDVNAPAGVPVCSGSQAAPCYTPLPNGYAVAPATGLPLYTFYSIAFNNGVGNYVLTFVPPPPGLSDNYSVGLLCLPGTVDNSAKCNGTQFSSAFGALYAQLLKSPLLSPSIWGTVSSDTLVIPAPLGAGSTPMNYPLPVGVVPKGSIGLIGQPALCPASTC